MLFLKRATASPQPRPTTAKSASAKPAAAKPKAMTVQIVVAEQVLEVVMRTNARARRYTLRLGARDGKPTVTIPKGGTFKEATAFIGRHQGWLEQRLANKPKPQSITAGSVVPIRGAPTRILNDPAARHVTTGLNTDGQPTLTFGGAPEHLQRRVKDYLVKQARADLTHAVTRYADRLGVKPSEIALRDTTSRWGSANSRGRLMFSWRLVLAPSFVLEYVAAHEVAHLREMNHSAAFWAHVTAIFGDYEPAKHWLKQHGPKIQALFHRPE